MPSNYTGVAANAVTALSLMTAGDRRTAQVFRVPLERLLDNDAKALEAIRGQGADNTGGATITLGAGKDFNLITSVVAITSFVFTEDVVGRSAVIRFDTIRTLTNNAAIVIPGGANITTAVGDRMQITRTTTGVSVDWYTRAAIVPGATASDTVAGVIEIATTAEVSALTDTTRAVVPGRLPGTSDTQQGLIEIATQAEQEAATDVVRAVTPGRQHFHPSAAKFWAYVTVSAGAPTLAASFNVTSITDTALGQMTVTIATDFSSANWACLASCRSSVSGQFTQVTAQSAGACTVSCINTTPAFVDPDSYSVAGFGDQ